MPRSVCFYPQPSSAPTQSLANAAGMCAAQARRDLCLRGARLSRGDGRRTLASIACVDGNPNKHRLRLAGNADRCIRGRNGRIIDPARKDVHEIIYFHCFRWEIQTIHTAMLTAYAPQPAGWRRYLKATARRCRDIGEREIASVLACSKVVWRPRLDSNQAVGNSLPLRRHSATRPFAKTYPGLLNVR